MCVTGFSCTPVVSISVISVLLPVSLFVRPSFHTQWTTHLGNNYQMTTQIKYNVADNMQI